MAELQSEDSDKTPVNASIACKNRRGKFITSKKWKTSSEKLSVMKKSRDMCKAKRKLITYENGEDSSGQPATTSDTLSEPQNKRRKRDQKVNIQTRVCYYHL